jgi:transposase
MPAKYKRKRPPFSSEEKESLITRINGLRHKWSDLLIAAELDIGASTVSRLAGPRKVDGRLVEARQNRKAMAIELHRQGLTIADVHGSLAAKGVKISKGAIYHWVRAAENG